MSIPPVLSAPGLSRRRACLAVACALPLASLALTGKHAAAHSGHHHEHHPGHPPATAIDVDERDAVVRLPELVLLDQHGEAIRLVSELIGERIVVVDFIYTSCTTVCPVASAMLSEVQKRLGERVGRDVRLVSITVDPLRDTPARLLEFSRRYEAGDGWFWVTGSPDRIARTLKGFGTWTPNFEDHPAVTMVGDGSTGRWTRFYGFTDPGTIVTAVEQLHAARVDASVLRPSAHQD